MFRGDDDVVDSLTENVRSVKKTLIRFTSWTGTLKVRSLYRTPWCQTLSNAFSKSRKIAAVLSFLLKVIARSSTSLVSWIVVECSGRKAYCSGRMKGETYDLRRFSIRISNSFDIVLSSEMGRWFAGSDLFFPGFGIMTTLACFHTLGKCDRRMQLLKILVRCNIVRLDACRRAVLGIPSGPGAFFLGRVFMMDLTSFGVMC